MKPNPKSIDQQRGYSGAGARNSVSRTNAGSQDHQQHGKISPWLPVALGAFAFLVVAKAIAETDWRRHRRDRWMSRLEDRWNDIWPDVRDTASESASRAGNWLYDLAPSRNRLADIFSTDNDWLPDIKASKRRLVQNLDWRNPPRWLREIDLSTSRKRRQFFKDLRRYGSRKGNELATSLGWR